ncbi:MAG: TldD/PmbA family protein [Bacilli bacterium]|nr:TldD/PmbA family protein [Bacilli bacterium]
MNIKKIFSKFKKNGIFDIEYRQFLHDSLDFNILDDKINNYSVNKLNNCNISSIINKKFSIINFDKTLNNINFKNILSALINSSKYIDKQDGSIYKKKSKYKNFNFFNKQLSKITIKEKQELMFKVNEQIKKVSDKIKRIEISYHETSQKNIYKNTAGIELQQNTNFFTINTSIIVSKDKIIKTNNECFEDNDLNCFNIEKYVKKLCDKALKKLNIGSVHNGVYDVVLSPKIVNLITYYYVSQLNAEKIIKKTSWFTNKIKTKIANEKITIIDKPLEQDMNFVPFDDQGVPTKNKILIKNGILKTYLHNLTTSKIFKVQPTGHAYLMNSKMSIKPHNVYLKPGKITIDNIIKTIKNGIYITELDGLHVGINVENGDFSLKAEGFEIKNGKIEKFIDMMTITYNLYKIFEHADEISRNIEYYHKKFSPCLLLKKKCFISCDYD